MTDKEKLIALLTEFGITPSLFENNVQLLAKEGGVKGYYCFFASFNFTDDGKFVDVGVWE